MKPEERFCTQFSTLIEDYYSFTFTCNNEVFMEDFNEMLCEFFTKYNGRVQFRKENQ